MKSEHGLTTVTRVVWKRSWGAQNSAIHSNTPKKHKEQKVTQQDRQITFVCVRPVNRLPQ